MGLSSPLGISHVSPTRKRKFSFTTMLVRSTIGLFQFFDFIELDLVSVHKNTEKNFANIQRS